MLSRANDLLKPLGREVVFVGGATVHLHVDDPGAAPVRTTKDVDVVVAVANYADFSRVEEELRQHGFEQLISEDSPICRWTKSGLLLM
jgi:predicted nucleotidyltransferase